MIKSVKIILCLMLMLTLSLSGITYADVLSDNSKPMRGIWVASVLNIDYPSTPTTDPEFLKAEALRILDTAQQSGLNAVFLQVRPTSDAFYHSQYFPWSKYLTGTQGVAPLNDFDPLTFWVAEAHKRGIELHAWLNPYRITKNKAGETPHNFDALAPTNPARLHPEWVVKHTDGNLYYNPGIPEVRQLIVNSALELVQNYDIDGIHFDDYFYPGRTFDDTATFAEHGNGFTSIEDWRRENVNILMRDLSRTIRSSSHPVRFGISPFGIWANKTSNPLGSNTNGNQTYYDHYADSLTWIREGSIDYIAPQIYWNIGHNKADYGTLLAWWSKAVEGSSVDLYIGHGAYRTGNTDPSSPWYGFIEIERQLALNTQYPNVKGSIFYNYNALAKNSALRAYLTSYYGFTVPKVIEPKIQPEPLVNFPTGGTVPLISFSILKGWIIDIENTAQ